MACVMIHGLLFSIVSFFALPPVYAVYFNVANFDPTETKIVYQGDAGPSFGKVEMNDVNFLCRVGWATYAEKVRLWDSKTGELSDFTSRYAFTIDTLGRSAYGHGLAFFLAPAGIQIPPNSAGGFFGLFNTSNPNVPHPKIVSVEFDSYVNPQWDPVYEHVGININSIASTMTTPWNASFHSGDTAHALVTYNASSKHLMVSWDYEKTPNPQESSSLSYKVDLMQVLPEWVTVGISSATGQFGEQNILRSWEFCTNFETEKTSGANAKKIKTIVSITGPIGILIFGVIMALLFLRRSRYVRGKTTETTNLTSMNEDLERGAGPRKFSYADLASATNNFSNQRKLGEGGFGGVYRGYLNDADATVAVKKISRDSRQGRKEYLAEVKIISQLRHRNLVQLVGWCHDRGEFLLVYEFMPNGSLDTHLWGKKMPLTWSLRYKIAQGLASGLLYLHEEWEQCVVHRDIKSSNIMLDSNFNVKLGDFGLARLMDHELGPQTTGVAGTFGYLAPEYMNTGKASKESDVYSFGVVALEIATGKKSIDTMNEFEMGLVAWAWGLYGRGMLLTGVDQRLKMEYEEAQVVCLMTVGLWCANPDHSLRPSIRQAIHVLNSEAALPNLSREMPSPLFHVKSPVTPVVSSGEPALTCTSFDIGR